MSKSLLRLAILSAPLVLTACGDGWEAQKTQTHFPYGNERTAGSGVVYVLAKMMPEKDLVLEPVMEKVEEEPEAVEPVLEAEEIFNDAQKKGAAPKMKKEPVSAAEKHTYLHEPDVHAVEPSAGVEVVEEDFAGYERGDALTSGNSEVEITAEDYIAQAPKRIVAKKVEVIKAQPVAAKASEHSALYGFEQEEVIEVYENEVIQPEKQIVVPKKDAGSYTSVGEEALDQIYNSDF